MKFQTQLILIKVFLIVMVCIISGVMYRVTTVLIDNSGWVNHTSQVIGHANALAKSMVDMETGQRGFMLTGNESFLEPYLTGQLDFNKTLESTISLVSDNPPQVKRLEQVGQLRTLWLETAGEYEINLKRQIDLGTIPKEALSHVLQGKTVDGQPHISNKKSGKQIMDEIRMMISEFIQVERGLMRRRVEESMGTSEQAKNTALLGAMLALFLGGGITLFMKRKLMGQLGAEPSELIAMSEDIAQGKLSARIKLEEAEAGTKTNVAMTLNRMAESMQETFDKLQKKSWQETSQRQLHEQMRGQHDIHDLAKRIVTQLCKQVSAEMGALYCCLGESTELNLMSAYAGTQNLEAANPIAVGEGLVGQAAQERRTIVISDVPEGFFPIASALGQASPRSVLVLPFFTDRELVGVIELCSFHPFSHEHISFIESVAESIAATMKASQNRLHMETLLGQTKQQADLLLSQSEEIRISREEREEREEPSESYELRMMNGLELPRQEVG